MNTETPGEIQTPIPGSRRVALPHGRTLVIRPVASTDVDGLATLYAGLDDESRYRRFFSISRPRRSYFEWIVAVAERGGAGLVAAITAEPALAGGYSELIVGEAGYQLLPSGDGELAITVDGKWRGWLGPYLLDALVELAASRGVPNLEADVLATNGPMLAVLRSRGNAFMPGDDWAVSRMLIGAASRSPSWPGSHQRPRLLVEGTGGHWHANDAARQAGLDVLACPGPSGRRRPCPALAGQPCPLAAGADAIVISHPLATDDWSALRAAHPRLHPGVPVCVELPKEAGAPVPPEVAAAGEGVDVVELVQRLATHPPSAVDP